MSEKYSPMKLIVLLLLFGGLSLPLAAQTTYILTSDVLDAKASYVKVRIDGVERPECGSIATPCMAMTGEKTIEYDLTPHANTGADVTIDAQACNGSGVCSIWSDPLVADLTPPGTPTGVRVTVNVSVTVEQ
jgi:hypothetical protein